MENTSTLQKAPKKGLNTAILILQFIGIVAVVLGHADGPGEDVPNFLTLAFPYYSWHMPFFIFISGYLFNREQTAGRYILKKVKTHLIPALIVNAICGIFAVCIKAWDIAKYGADITLKALFVTPFTTGYQFFINVSLWFIFALFVIEVVACLLDRVTKGKADWIFLIVFCAVSLVCAYLPYVNHDGTRDEFLNATLRNGYLFFFFWLGVCYKKYAEKYVAKFINWKLSIGIFLVQALFLVLSDYTITTNVRNMVINTITVPNGYWTALVAPITATLFFMGIANSLAPYLQGSKTLALVGRNTRYIVYWHQFIFVLCSYIVGCLIKCNVIGAVEGFDFTHLYKKQYYAGGNVTLICVISIVSFIVPLLIFPNVNKIKNRYIRWGIFAGLIGLVVLLLYIASCIL